MSENNPTQEKDELRALQQQLAELKAELKRSQDLRFMYEQLLDSTRDIVVVKDRTTHIVYGNQALSDLYGIPKEEIKGMVDIPINRPEHTSQYLADDAYVMDTGNTLFIPEEPSTRHDGLIRIFETIKSPIRDRDGNIQMVVGVARDITDRTLLEEDRRRAENTLDYTERLFRQMAESMRDVFWIAAPDFSSFVYVSPAYESCWGRPCKELLQDPKSWWKVVYPPDLPVLVQKFEALVEARDLNFSHEFRIVKDDQLRWLWIRTFPVFDVDGNLIRICGITHDISERKEAERRVTEFNSMVSHELRTPLTSIRAALGLIEGGQTKGLGETLDLVHIARVECERMGRLINDLLDIKKIESERLELKIEQLAPLDIVDAVLSAHRGYATESGITLRADVSTNERFTGDRDRIIQVMTNLVSNAIKFSPPGKEVLLSVHIIDGGKLRFSVADEGPGIPEPARNKLFVAFQQIDSSDSRDKGGTGLGLAISKAIIERHGGTIGFNSKDDRGCIFWFELPSVLDVNVQGGGGGSQFTL
jgi:PAS domain S-box-containing protein